MSVSTATSVVLCTAGYDHKINFWKPPTGKCTHSLWFSDSQVNRLSITLDKQFLAAAGNPQVKLFEIASQSPNPVVAYDGHTTNVTDVGFQKEGKWMFTGSEDGSIKIWDLRAPGCQRNYICKSPVHALALHPNQAELISGDQSGRMMVCEDLHLFLSCYSFEIDDPPHPVVDMGFDSQQKHQYALRFQQPPYTEYQCGH
eukprot:222791_1